MKLYLLTQYINNGYDTYDSCVVAAPDEQIARLMHPSEHDGQWWDNRDKYGPAYSWAFPENVSVTYIGEAKEGTEQGVILASFNAG